MPGKREGLLGRYWCDEVPGVNYDIGKRWENGVGHHPKSVELFTQLAKIDYRYCYDSFHWKSGGDGDNGETLMYLLDIIFEEQDAQAHGPARGGDT